MRSKYRIAASIVFLTTMAFNLSCDRVLDKREAEFVSQEKLAKSGNSEAQNWLAIQYADGEGFVKEDPKLAFYWAEKAANSGNAVSQYNLATYYEQGEGVKQDMNLAVSWYKRCASNGKGKWQANALNSLAVLTFDGIDTSETRAGAYEWIAQAAIQNDPHACFVIGMHHQRVGYTEEDQRIAKAFFETGAEKGLSKAQLLLGILYFNGKFIRHDYDKAFSWVQKSAQQNYPDAQLLLSVFYEKGVGTPVNMDLSSEWREKSESQAKSDGTINNFKLPGLLLRSGNPSAK